MTAIAERRASLIERFIMALSPAWGLRRARARVAPSVLARHYEAAANSRRTSGWRGSASDANAAAARSLPRLRELSRDLQRNNGWARRGVQVIRNNVVGWGIYPKAVSRSDSRANRAREAWNDWAESVGCDWDGQLDFYGLQALVVSTVVQSGECLILREPAPSSDGLAIPLRLRVLEPDYLDTGKDALEGPSGGPIQQGIELDGRGRRVAYWLFEKHPGACAFGGMQYESRRVLAKDVLHVYWLERPGQLRGVPWLCAAIAKLQDFGDYDDAALVQQKIAACFGAFVQDLDGAATAIGDADECDDAIETLEPGHIAYLPPGKTVTFAQPPKASDHGQFTTSSLRQVSAALGVTYEDLTGDYSQVNYSSARLARIAHWANVENWRWHMLVPQLCAPVWSWSMQLMAGLYNWPEVPRAEWSPPPMAALDPEKESKATTQQVRSGTLTLFQAIRERGEDPRRHLEEIAEGNRLLDELGIVLESDPRRSPGQPALPDEAAAAEGPA